MTSLVLVNDYSTFQGIADIRSKEAYCDATIACDGKFYKVHRLVLSASSEYLEKLFEQGNNGLCNCNCSSVLSHPVIVLQNIKKEHFEALLDYMYEGEVSVSQPLLPNIIRAAELLKIKGLTISEGEQSIRVLGPDFGNIQGKRSRPQDDQVSVTNRASSSRKNLEGENLSSVKRQRNSEEYEKPKDAKNTNERQVSKSSKSTVYRDSSNSISKNSKSKEASASSSLAIKSPIQKQRELNKGKTLEKKPFVIPKRKLHLEIPEPSYPVSNLSLVKREPLSDSGSEKSVRPISDTLAMSHNSTDEEDNENDIEPSVRREKIKRKSVTEPVHPMSDSDLEDDPRILDVDEQTNENLGKDTSELSDKDASQSSASTLNVSNLQKLGHLDKRNFMRKWKGHVEAIRDQHIKDVSKGNDKNVSKDNNKATTSPNEARIKDIRNTPNKNQERSSLEKRSIIRSSNIAANILRAEQLQKKQSLGKSEMRKSYDKECTNGDDQKRAELANMRYRHMQAKNMKGTMLESSKRGITSPEPEKQNDTELETNSVDSNEGLQPLGYAASESGKSIAKSVSEKESPDNEDDGRGFICHICSKVYHKRVAFLNHYKIHTGGGDMPYGCPHCARHFYKKVELVKHVKGHTATRPYPCSHCPRRFTLKSCMLIHIQYHSGPKTFACPHCTRCFEDKTNIKRHIMTHTGVPIASAKSSVFSVQN